MTFLQHRRNTILSHNLGLKSILFTPTAPLTSTFYLMQLFCVSILIPAAMVSLALAVISSRPVLTLVVSSNFSSTALIKISRG